MQTSGEDRRRIRDLSVDIKGRQKALVDQKVVKLDKVPPDSRAPRTPARLPPNWPLKTSTIDGLTLDECVFRFEQVMREGRNADGTPGKFFDLLTSVQLAAAKVEFSRRVKAKVQASAEDTIRREREQNLIQTDADFEHLMADAP